MAAEPFCTSSSDCSLTGVCVNSTRCECDAGWRGRRCESLDLGSSSEAIRPASGGGPWTWGGSPAFDAKTSRWHLFYSFMIESCGLLHYQTNSIVRRAISLRGCLDGLRVREVQYNLSDASSNFTRAVAGFKLVRGNEGGDTRGVAQSVSSRSFTCSHTVK